MATTRRTTTRSTTKKSQKTKEPPAGTGARDAAPRKPAASARKRASAPRPTTRKPSASKSVAAAVKRAAPPKAVAAPSKESTREAAARKLALMVAEAALDKKAESIEVIDIRGRVDYADFLVVMSGRSDRHVVAVAQGIEQALAQKGQKCLAVEGLPQGQWVLMDFGDVIGHVFLHDRRSYYDLEGLWLDAERIPLSLAAAAGAAAR